MAIIFRIGGILNKKWYVKCYSRFLQDNDLMHALIITKSCFKGKMINIFPWRYHPSYLNPKENLRHEIKCKTNEPPPPFKFQWSLHTELWKMRYILFLWKIIEFHSTPCQTELLHSLIIMVFNRILINMVKYCVIKIHFFILKSGFNFCQVACWESFCLKYLEKNITQNA